MRPPISVSKLEEWEETRQGSRSPWGDSLEPVPEDDGMSDKIEPSRKSPVIEALLSRFRFASHDRASAISQGGCFTCDSSTNLTEASFRDELARKEYAISHMCQACQDLIFNEESGG